MSRLCVAALSAVVLLLAPGSQAQAEEASTPTARTMMLEGTSKTPELLITTEPTDTGLVVEEAPEATADPGDAEKADFMRVTGRFGYRLPDGRFLPAPNIQVHPYRKTPVGDLWCLPRGGSGADGCRDCGFTDEDGYFDVTFELYGCVCARTDIFLMFNAGPVIKPKGNPCALDAAYDFDSGVYYDVVKNTTLDIGTHIPDSVEGNAAVHAKVNLDRARNWFQDQGLGNPNIEIWWNDDPVPVTRLVDVSEVDCWQCWYDTYIRLAPSEWFNDFEIAKIAANWWLTENNTPICPDHCEVSTCYNCLWCPSSEEAYAFWDGAISWMATEILDGIPADRIYRQRDIDGLGSCLGSPPVPELTAGIFAAALRDISDPDFDDHPEYPGVRDRANWGPSGILSTINIDEPRSPMEFFEDYRARFPGRCPQMWETLANCGYDIDVIGPGVVQGGVTSSSHVASVPSPDVTVDVAWGTPNDDCAGIDGYSVSATPNVPALPDAIMDIGAVNAWTSNVLTEGSWWINVRAVDNSGRWSNVYASFGPVIIQDPTPANLLHMDRPGWAARVVPQPAASSTSTNCPTPSALTGNSKSTWWNVSIQNDGSQSTGIGFATWVQADGLGFYNPLNPVEHAVAFPALAALSQTQAVNLGPIQVGGGRHTFGAFVDFVGEIAEANEFDNGWARSWVWSPLQVPVGGSAFRLSPPPRIGGWEYDPSSGYFNCDGLRFTQSPDVGTDEGYWNALTLVPVDEEVDYDARLHVASTGPENGFKANSGYSSRPAGCLDAVFVNYNQESAPNWDVGIVQTTDVPALSSYESRHVRSVLQPYGTPVLVTMPANQAMLLNEFYVDGLHTGWNSFVVQSTNGEGPFHVMWLDQGFTTGDMDDYSATAASDASGVARLDVNIGVSGYSCLVVYRDPKDGTLGVPVDYIIELNAMPPDLVPLTAAGWARPLVPRPAPDIVSSSDVPLPTFLNGGSNPTYLNLASENASIISLSGSVLQRIFVDGVQTLDIQKPVGYGGNEIFGAINQGPIEVRGGLHTLVAKLDGPDDYVEISESNNFHGDQWAWSGQALAFGPSQQFPQPPDPSAGWEYVSAAEVWFNADGARTPVFDPGGAHGMWGGVIAIPNPEVDVSMRLHLPSDDPLLAFRDPLVTSTWGGDGADFVLADFSVLPAGAFDVGVSHASGTGGYNLQVVTSSDLDPGLTPKLSYALNGGELMRLFEVPLMTGPLQVHLQNLSGGADLGLALYESGIGALSRADNLAPSSAIYGESGEDEELTVYVPADGIYCLVVFKERGDDAFLDAQYGLEFLTSTAAPGLPRSAATLITGIYPNPFNPRTSIAFELAEQGEVELNIFNVRGELIRRLVRSNLSAGPHQASWDGIDDRGRVVASGTYVAQLVGGGIEDRRKMVLIK